MNNYNKLKSALLIPMLICGGDLDYKFADNEPVEYLMDGEISDIQVMVYLKIIEWINAGKKYDEIYKLVDELNLEEFNDLTNDKIDYIKRDAKKVITLRKRKEMI